jgi:membrane protease YdiL (CAAX protease family)/ABC-type multidrug transport system permease subunit
MSRYRRAGVIYRKELVETLRDRRTLAAMLLVPIVLYPVLMIVVVEALRVETGRRRAEQYRVCVPDAAHRLWLRGVLEREDREYEFASSAPGEGPPDAGLSARIESRQIEIDVLDAGESLWDAVDSQTFHAAVIVDPPPDAEGPFDATNRVVQIVHCDTDPRSDFVFVQLGKILANESARVIRARVADLPGGAANLTPLLTHHLSTSSPREQFAKILAMVVPFLLVIMTVTGALYPAIDLTAGERERGTLETLAVSPVPTGQIVAGKFGVIVTIAMITTMLNLASMTAVFHFNKVAQLAVAFEPARDVEFLEAQERIESAAAARGTGAERQLSHLQRREALETAADSQSGFFTTAAPIVLLAMLPFAVLAGAIMLATCSFARTFKEAQNYMMPVMIAFMVPSMVVSYMPTTRLEGLLLVIPVANIVVLIRELFLGNYDAPAMGICLLSTCFYAAAAVAVAARVYGHEAVLFSDVGSYKTLLRRRFFSPRPAPSPAGALMAVAVLFPVYFYWQSYLIDEETTSERLKLVIAGAQICVLALPAAAICWYFKLDWRRTFSLRAPPGAAWIGTALIAAAVVPIANFLREIQFHFFPPGYNPAMERFAELLTHPLFGVIVVLAVIPGVCEEALFRGFLLSGLRQRLGVGPAALSVGLIFGLFHMNADQLPVHSLIGVLLALVCMQSGSLLPAIAIHVANNTMPILAARYEWIERFLGFSLPGADDAGPAFTWRTACFAAAMVVGIVVVARSGEARSAAPASFESADESAAKTGY